MVFNWLECSPYVPSIDLGYGRDPSQGGSMALLRVAMGQERGFEIVPFDFYGEQLKRFKQLLAQDTGNYSWVIGGRGTGKSEVLGHLFRETISEAHDTPRLPLYISISGVEEDNVNMPLFNRLCRDELLKSFNLIRGGSTEGKGKESNPFVKLNDSLQKGWQRVEEILEDPKFSLVEFLRKVDGSEWEDALRLVIVFDDMDKISTRSAIGFFNNNQTDLANIINHGGVILTSVTKEFIKEARETDGLSYCVSRSYQANSPRELTIPEITDLTSEELQEFIDHRIKHLHETNGSWIFRENVVPHSEVSDVQRHELWDSYNTSSMRRNGALLTLNMWSARQNLVALRNVVVSLEGVLEGCTVPKKELTAKILERSLNRNNDYDTENIIEALIKRIVGLSSERITIELQNLDRADPGKNSILWGTFSNLVMDYIAFDSWTQNPTYKGLKSEKQETKKRVEKLTKQFNQDSAVFQMLNLFAEIARDNEAMPEIQSRTPGELLGKISERTFRLILQNIVHDSDGREQGVPKKSVGSEAVAGGRVSKDEDPDREEKSVLPISARAYNEVMKEYLSEGQGPADLSETEREYLGGQIALKLVQYIIGKGNWGKVSIKIRKNFEKEPLSWVRAFQAWCSLRIRGGAQDEILRALHDVIRGLDLQALEGREQEFEEILQQEAISHADRVLGRIKNGDVWISAPPYCEMDWKSEFNNNADLASILSKKTLALPQEKVTITLKMNPRSDGVAERQRISDIMVEMLTWLDDLDHFLDGESGLSGSGTSLEYDSLAESSLRTGRDVDSPAKVTVNLQMHDDPSLVFSSMLVTGEHADTNWLFGIKESWTEKNQKSQFTLKGEISREHYFIERLYFVFMRDGTEHSRRRIHNM